MGSGILGTNVLAGHGFFGFDPTPNASLSRSGLSVNSSGGMPTIALNTAPDGNAKLTSVKKAPTNTGNTNPQVLGANTQTPSDSVYSNGGGAGGGSGSGAGGADYSAQIGSLDAQANSLRNTLANTDTQLNQGLYNIDNQFNQQQNDANTARSRALSDLQTQEQNDNLGHEHAIDQVNTKARTLAQSVRQMIGGAAGSGSSAYQITAPGAVARQANLQSEGINTDFGQNATALKTTKDRAQEDFDNLQNNLKNTRSSAIQNLRSGVLGQVQQINGSLADIAAQRAAYAGGGVSGARAAASPYEANIAANQQALNGLFDQYKTPFANVKPVTVAAPTLRDYVAGNTNVATNPATTATQDTGASYNPLSSWLKQDQNQYSF